MSRIAGIHVEIPPQVQQMISSIQQPMNDIQNLIEDDQKESQEIEEFESKVYKLDV